MLNKKDKQRFIEELRKTPVIQVACQKANIGRTTYYRWRKEDKKFAEFADLALQEGRLVVNDLGEAQTISLMKDRDMQAIRFWLTHNNPRYSNKLEIKGHITGAETLTKAQKKLLRRALKLAIPQQSYEQRKSKPRQDRQSDDQESNVQN